MTFPTTFLAVAGLAAVTFVGLRIFRDRQRLRARRLYEAQLESALADGVLSAEEMRELQAFRSSKELTEAEARMVALAQYRRVLNAAAADARFTDAEREHLRSLHEQLGLSADDLSQDRAQLHRLWLFSRIEHGRLPVVDSPIKLAEDERCHWIVRATACGRTGLPSNRPEPEALRFDVGATRPFEASGARDAIEPDPRFLPMDIGTVIVTDRRLVFRGARRRFAVPHLVLRGVLLYRDAIRLEIDRSAPVHLIVEDPELTAAILLRAATDRRGLSGSSDASPARTA